MRNPPIFPPRPARGLPRRSALLLALAALPCSIALAADPAEGDLSYRHHVDSPHRFKCLYGYAADKTGDHAAAVRIFEDCIARWNDVYSMIWLAHLLESGNGVPRDEARAAALMRRGAETGGSGGYAALARYHWGRALAEGRGVARDPALARHWLQRAADEGVAEAGEALARLEADPGAAEGPQ